MQHAIRSVSPSCPAEFMQNVPVGGWSWCWSTDKSLVKALIVTMFISYCTDFFVNNFKLNFNIKWDTNNNFLIHFILPAFLLFLPKAFTVTETPKPTLIPKWTWQQMISAEGTSTGSHTRSWETRALRVDQLQSNTQAWLLTTSLNTSCTREVKNQLSLCLFI